MPAPKKQPHLKDQTRIRRETRKHRRACRRLLGPLGTFLFREFLNLHGRFPIEITARWAEAIAQALGDEGSALSTGAMADSASKKLADYRGQFGGWSQAWLRRELKMPPPNDRTCFVLRRIDVEGAKPDSWKAMVLLLYERRSGVLFHHLVRTDEKWVPTGHTVWFALDKARRYLKTSHRGRAKLSETTSQSAIGVMFPIRSDERSTDPIFSEARRLLTCHQASGSNMTIHGAPSQKIDLVAADWQASAFHGLHTTRLNLGRLSFRELQLMLRDDAGSITKELKIIGDQGRTANKTIGSSEKNITRHSVLDPAWIPLFPVRKTYEFHSPRKAGSPNRPLGME